jgi:hypothetical protein
VQLNNLILTDFAIAQAGTLSYHTNPPTVITPDHLLAASVDFCYVATRIQDRLAISPLLQFEEMEAFDAALSDWHNNLPTGLRTQAPCSPSIHMARAVIKWRYQNLRILLHRSVLLDAALRGVPHHQLLPREQRAIDHCRSIANDTIIDIAAEWTPNQMSGWNAVWFLFQATMIPLVSIFSEKENLGDLGKWRGEIETSLRLFEHMESWSVQAKRSREVVARIYEASKLATLANAAAQVESVAMMSSTPTNPCPLDSIPGHSQDPHHAHPLPHQMSHPHQHQHQQHPQSMPKLELNAQGMPGTFGDDANMDQFWDEMLLWDNYFPGLPFGS